MKCEVNVLQHVWRLQQSSNFKSHFLHCNNDHDLYSLFKYLGNPKDSVWEDWGTLGKIKGINHHPPLDRITTRFAKEVKEKCGVKAKAGMGWVLSGL